MAANPHLRLVAPTIEKQTVATDMARRRPNAELRSHEHLTADEVKRLIAAAKMFLKAGFCASIVLRRRPWEGA